MKAVKDSLPNEKEYDAFEMFMDFSRELSNSAAIGVTAQIGVCTRLIDDMLKRHR